MRRADPSPPLHVVVLLAAAIASCKGDGGSASAGARGTGAHGATSGGLGAGGTRGPGAGGAAGTAGAGGKPGTASAAGAPGATGPMDGASTSPGGRGGASAGTGASDAASGTGGGSGGGSGTAVSDAARTDTLPRDASSAGTTDTASAPDATPMSGATQPGPASPPPPSPNLASGAIFLAPMGSDSTGTGATDKPFATLNKAHTLAKPGDVIVLRGGTYRPPTGQFLSVSGTAQRPITVMSAPGEWAVLDFTNAPAGARMWMENVHFNVVRDLEVANSRGQGFFIAEGSSDNIFVNVVVRDPNGSAFQIFRGSRNRFFECLALFTRSSAQTPGDADGMGSIGRGGPSVGNQFIRCVAVDAPDDGFDSWEGAQTTFIGNWVIRAGRHGGNGNGFKAGPGPGAPNSVWNPPAPADTRGQAKGLLRRNAALDCTGAGFDANGGAQSRFEHNTAHGNAMDFAIYANDNPTSTTNILVNNLSIKKSPGVLQNAQQTTNAWNTPPGITLTAADFLSTTAPPTSAFVGKSGTAAWRMLWDGEYASLLRPKPGTPSLDQGTDVGEPTRGKPDLGAFERW